MKQAIIILVVSFPLFCFAQQKNIYDTASEKICEYMNKNPDRKITTTAEAEAFFSEAFLDVCMPMLDRLMAVEGVSSFDGESGRKMGEKIGLKLAATCPKYLEVMHPVLKASMNDADDVETGTLKGTITEVTQDNYTFLKLKMADGSLKRAVWLTAFNESENFNNDPQNLIGKKVEVKWKSASLFYYKSKSYSTEKIITGIKMN
ncbi:MAG: hypothetical protein ABUT20_04995 [Bacteroidota bacterium]